MSLGSPLRVLVTAPYARAELPRYREVLERHGVELVVPEMEERLEEAALLERVAGIDGALCGNDRFTARVLEAADRLKVVAKWGTGIDAIDGDAAVRLGIAVRNTPGGLTEPVADTTLGYLLAFARNIPWMDRDVRAGGWQKTRGRTLGESTVGVVGVGTIGRAVIRRLGAFGATILGNDVREVDPAFLGEWQVEMTPLGDLLARADFVTLHTDLNPTSRHLISRPQLRRMKPTAYLVNTSRGPVVDEAALVEALREGRIAGAALDVFESEPLPPDHPLLACERCLFAPHSASTSPRAWAGVHRSTVRQLLEALRPGEPVDLRGFFDEEER